MTPPPTMMMCFGQTVISSSPVESTTPGRSTPGMGIRAGLEPVATIRCLHSKVSPLSNSTVVREAMVALALNTVTPWLFSRAAMPPLSCLETAFFRSMILA